MAWTFFNKNKNFIASGINLNNGQIKVLLLKAGTLIGGVAPTAAANVGDAGLQYVADLVPGTNEVSGTNYARTAFGSQGVSGPVSGVWTFAGTGPSYAQSASGFNNGQYAVAFDDSGASDATKKLIAIDDLGGSVGNVAALLQLNTDTGNAIITEG
jgi:hypothetical protein